jgi:hypothetical protein
VGEVGLVFYQDDAHALSLSLCVPGERLVKVLVLMIVSNNTERDSPTPDKRCA